MALYVPGLHPAFATTSLGVGAATTAVALALVPLASVELFKTRWRRGDRLPPRRIVGEQTQAAAAARSFGRASEA